MNTSINMNIFKRTLPTKNDYINKNATKYCNNCGNSSHILYQCNMPIVSIGTIIFRKFAYMDETGDEKSQIEYLMIRRKDTLGYVDFLRGKYAIDNKEYLMRMFNQMTIIEKTKIQEGNFDQLWKELWGKTKISNQYKIEEKVSQQKFRQISQGAIDKTGETFSINSMISESNMQWEEQEWGFPKGRRNYQENDYVCALREMTEETGYSTKNLRNIHNIIPYEEIFTGSNDKVYKHRYYLLFMEYTDSLPIPDFQKEEVSGMEWMSYEECMKKIRIYNTEKRNIISKINNTLTNYLIV
jgi:ADP-ribose pyrophosphatase YjhB (NUDIX family)